MKIKDQFSVTRKVLHLIMVLGIFLSTFGGANLQSVGAQEKVASAAPAENLHLWPPVSNMMQGATTSCPSVSGIVWLYDLADCGGESIYVTAAGFANLSTIFNDRIESVAIPVGWSVRLYQNAIENINESACFGSTDTNLNDNTFGNGVVVGNNATFMRVYTNSTCAMPDLVIQSISALPLSPAVNQAVTFTVRVKNQGTLAVSSSFFVDLFIDAVPGSCPTDGTKWWEVTSLAAGATQDLNYTYPGFSTSGTHNVYAMADTTCVITESNVTNNTLGPGTLSVQPATQTLTVSKNGTGSGTVTSSPAGINCGSTCSYGFAFNTLVTLTATPTFPSTFGGWSGAGCSGTGTCTVTMSAAQSITAAFNAETEKPVVNWIAPVGNEQTHYVTNELVTLTVSATDNVSVKLVNFSRWDAVNLTQVDIGNDFTSPFSVSVNSATLNVGWNQIDALASDEAGNISNSAFIWLYRTEVYELTVAKNGTGSGTVTSSPAGINCGSTCSYGFTFNTLVTLTATPTSPSTFGGWSGAGCSGTGTCTVTMNAAQYVTATFNSPGTQTLTVSKAGAGSGTVTSSPAGINCGSTCSYGFTFNTLVTLTATPTSPSTFGGWSGASCSGTGTCTVTMNAAQSVTATFNSPGTQTLTVSKAGAGSGTVTSSPAGINCGSTCSYGFTFNTLVTLTATPTSPSTFGGWSGAGCSGTGTCTVTMNAAQYVTATFNSPGTQTLTVSKAGAGSGTVTSSPAGINCGSTCSYGFTFNTLVTLTATPTSPSTFGGWSGASCSGTGTCTVTMNAAQSVTATFNSPGTQTLTVSKAGAGSGTVTSSPAGINCGSTCSYGFTFNTLVTLTATPTSPSTFGGWSGAGCSGTGTCTVTMNAAQYVTATFNSPGTQTLTVSKAGTGSGTVTSSPAGINCGSTCSYGFTFNTLVTLTATPTSPSTFGGWSGAGCSGTGTCTVTMSAVQSVAATFNQSTNAITAQFPISQGTDDAGMHYACGSATNYNEVYFGKCGNGSSITTGFRFANVTIPPGSQIISANIKFTVDGTYNNDISVTFYGESSGNAQSFSIASMPAARALTNASINWPIPASDVWMVSQNRTSPDIGNMVQEIVNRTDWSSGNALAIIARDASAPSTLGSQRRVFAYERAGSPYAAQLVVIYTNPIPPVALTVSKIGTGSGVVTSLPTGINCGVTCSYAFAYNAVVTLTATPAAGSTFTGWSGAGCAGTGTCTVTMSSAQFVTATFAAPNAGGGSTTGVFRPSNGLLYLKNANTTGFADVAINYGTAGDYPVAGDWDGNGTATIGIYRNGFFYLRNSNTLGFADIVFAFGTPGDQPVAGDWDGDGVDTIGVYSNGQFLLRNTNTSGSPNMSFYLGNPGDVGIAGDWNGDGLDTTGVFRPSNGIIFLKNANSTGFADVALNYGMAGDMPVTGDWNNDGIDTIGVYRNAQFLLRNSNTIGFADIVFGLGNPVICRSQAIGTGFRSKY